ncbi:MAG TPA: hypothetical protein VIY26_12215 [Acidimicrobiales bacterium]
MGTAGYPVDEERIEMNQGLPGHEPGDAAATDESGLAERLIRDEFSDPAPAQRARSHREAKHAVAAETSSVAQADGAGADPGAHTGTDDAAGALWDETAKVRVVEVGPPAADDTIVLAAPIIHEEFTQPKRAPKSRSHRAGMLAGLGVVGVLLVVLVVFAPGGSKPRLPAQSVHDVSPISASGPKTAAATTPTTAVATTTPPAPASTTTTPPKPGGTITTYISYTEVPGSTTPAQTVTPATTASAPPPTTAPPQTTTTTTPPPTTTTPTTHCLLIFCS